MSLIPPSDARPWLKSTWRTARPWPKKRVDSLSPSTSTCLLYSFQNRNFSFAQITLFCPSAKNTRWLVDFISIYWFTFSVVRVSLTNSLPFYFIFPNRNWLKIFSRWQFISFRWIDFILFTLLLEEFIPNLIIFCVQSRILSRCLYANFYNTMIAQRTLCLSPHTRRRFTLWKMATPTVALRVTQVLGHRWSMTSPSASLLTQLSWSVDENIPASSFHSSSRNEAIQRIESSNVITVPYLMRKTLEKIKEKEAANDYLRLYRRNKGERIHVHPCPPIRDSTCEDAMWSSFNGNW